MQQKEKVALTRLGKEEYFSKAFRKLNLSETLSEEEKSYLLTCAILLLRHYANDNRFTSYAELAYFIVLKYAINCGDFKPLYDFAISFGYYPIASEILNLNLIERNNINLGIDEYKLKRFVVNNQYTRTIEQEVEAIKFLRDESKEKSFIAPTSYGKSSIIVDYINNNIVSAKILIVVPTKSLLAQTYRMIKESKIRKKLIIHDEMYNNDDSFIAILTQERALRLMSKKIIHYDLIFIDEAHNLLKKDDRSILLSRLLQRNLDSNPNQEVVYLSPFVNDENALKVKSNQKISSHKIRFNVKEPEIFELTLDGSLHKYSRFINQFFNISNNGLNYLDYIIENSRNKNFIYHFRPIYIEQFSKLLYQRLDEIIVNEQINSLVELLKKEVHKDFYAIEYLKKGIVYIHGKIPDLIKEFLESKYSLIPELRFLIANMVVLEGMNLPIENLYIMSTRLLGGKELTNLIGRVNRLNNVFNGEGNKLNKLLPKVHFINTEEFNRSGSKMENQIVELRSRVFDDNVENPNLESFDLDKYLKKNSNKENKVKKINEVLNIQKNEDLLSVKPKKIEDRIRHYIIETGINQFYKNVDKLVSILLNVNQLKNDESWTSLNMLEKIYSIFIQNISEISDNELKRLEKETARNYYENYILIRQKKSLNENIISQYEYFKKKASTDNPFLYVGKSYGEKKYPYKSDSFSFDLIYVDLSIKTDQELVNLAIVKLKLEDDFISFKLNKFIVMLYDFGLVSKDDYHLYIYGTIDVKKIELNKYGLNIGLISRLQNDDQIKNLYFDEFNNLKASKKFIEYLNTLNDFQRFEINRFID